MHFLRMIEIGTKFELQFVDRLHLTLGLHVGSQVNHIHLIGPNALHPHNHHPAAMQGKHSWPPIPCRTLQNASLSMLFKMNATAAFVKHAVNTELPLHDLGCR
jgi:hypothetical protein